MKQSKAKLSKNLHKTEALDIREIAPSAWDEIADMEAQKNIIEKKIVLPLLHPDLAKKHGVVLPKAILLFGPPGTGKTAFAKGVAGRLGWIFIEVSPSELVLESVDTEARQLKIIFEQLLGLERAVVFFDEFEEIALRPDKATKSERMVSNEMLKQIPKFRGSKEVLLVCATNHIRLLNPALLRPGRFDYILPIGPLDKEARKKVFAKYLESLNVGEVDLDIVAEKSRMFSPADIQSVCAQVAHIAFEKEVSTGREYKVITNDLLGVLAHHKATVSKNDLEQFQKDISELARCAEGCDYCFKERPRPEFGRCDDKTL